MPRRRAVSGNLGRLVGALVAILSVACQPFTSPGGFMVMGRVIEDAPAFLIATAADSPPPRTTPIAGAVITVVDGPRAGLTAIADANGRYTLSGLTGTVTNIQATSPAHESRTYAVNSAKASLDFNLTPFFQLLTETVSGTISTHAWYDCAGACMWRSMPIHHSGTLTASLTWSPSSADVGFALVRGSEYVWADGQSGPLVITAPVLAGSYYLQISAYEGPLPVEFTLVISRPN